MQSTIFFLINEVRMKIVFILLQTKIAKVNSTFERMRNEKVFHVRSKVASANGILKETRSI